MIKEVENKDSEQIVSTLSDEKISKIISDAITGHTLRTLSFCSAGIAIYPEYKHLFEVVNASMKKIFPEFGDIVSGYFKDKSTEIKSIKIDMNQNLKELIESAEDCKIKSGLINSQKIQSRIVKAGNVNFAKAIFNDESGRYEFYGVTKDFLKKKYDDFIRAYLLNRSWTLSQVAREIYISEDKGEIRFLSRFCSEVSNKLNTYQVYDPNIYAVLASGRNMSPFIDRKGSLFHMMSDEKLKKQFIKTILINGTVKLQSYSISSIINSIITTQEFDADRLYAHSRIEKVQSVNPISGFVSEKNTRIPKKESKLTQEEIDVLAENVRLNNKFFESIAHKILEKELKAKELATPSIKLVEGSDIIAYYNISSYKKVAGVSRETGEWNPFSGATPGGTLYNSCMRHPQNKLNIKFYAANKDLVSLMICTDGHGKKITARAIVWKDKENNLFYVDRIFSSSEKALMQMVNFVKANDNYFFINSSGLSNSSIAGKMNETFLIKFNGVNQTTTTPYFDTMRNNAYIKDNELYIGRHTSSSLPLKTELMVKGKIYDTNKSFYLIPKVDLSKTPLSNTEICPACGYALDQKFVIVNGRRICKRHMTVDTNGDAYIYTAEKIIPTDGKKNVGKFLYSGILSDRGDEKMLFEPNDITRLPNDTRIITNVMRIFEKHSKWSYEDARKIEVEAKLKEIESFSTNSLFQSNTRSDVGKLSSFQYERPSYDNKSIKLMHVGGSSIVIPVNPTKNEILFLREVLKLEILSSRSTTDVELVKGAKEKIVNLISAGKREGKLSDPYCSATGKYSDVKKIMELTKKITLRSMPRSFSYGMNPVTKIMENGNVKPIFLLSVNLYDDMEILHTAYINSELVELTKEEKENIESIMVKNKLA